MAELELKAEVRENTHKGYAKQLRKEGKIPGVFYAQGETTVPIVVDEREMVKILTSDSGLIDIRLGDKRKRKAIVKEYQTDPVKQRLFHVDIMGVKLKEKLTVPVSINITGAAVGVKDHGGVLHQYLREIDVTCLPLDIPDSIDVDVSELNIGDSVTVGTLSLENATVELEDDQPIVSVLAPTVVKEEVEEVEEGELEEGEEGAGESEDAESSDA